MTPRTEEPSEGSAQLSKQRCSHVPRAHTEMRHMLTNGLLLPLTVPRQDSQVEEETLTSALTPLRDVERPSRRELHTWLFSCMLFVNSKMLLMTARIRASGVTMTQSMLGTRVLHSILAHWSFRMD